MKRTVIIYGLLMAALIAALKVFEYKYIIRDLSLEFYLGIIAFLFTGLGIWAGIRLVRRPSASNANVVSHEPDHLLAEKLGITKRELEVLSLMAAGLSNQEIAEKLFVSLSTVKTHSSNLFAKLNVKRRTQAIQKSKELRLL
ncbi:MAG TPA: LuxR C-terminal-related transcriptional regulator [Chryseosolibacter sp.]|nr:LuxR C-terminal-related transcriptional regulator [Chryseosolibacter sp.]